MLKYKSSKLVLIAVVSLVMAWVAAADVYGVNQIWGPAETIEVNESETVSFSVSALDDDSDDDPDFYLILVSIDPQVTTHTFDTTTFYPYPSPETERDSILGQLEWVTDFSSSGSYEFVFAASDNSSHSHPSSNAVYVTVYVQVNNVNQPPVLAPIDNQSTDEQQLLAFAVSATDPDGDTPALALGTNDLPVGPTYFTDNGDGTGIFGWLPTYTDFGEYTATFYAIDNTVEPPVIDSETITITVHNINHAPTISVLPSSPLTIQEMVVDTVTFYVHDSDLVEDDNLAVSFLQIPTFGSTDLSTSNDTTVARVILSPGYCETGVDDSYFTVTVRAEDDSGVVTELSKNFAVSDAENVSHSLSVDAMDVDNLFLNFPIDTLDTIRVAGYDRDCDVITYTGYVTDSQLFVHDVTPDNSTFTPVGDSQEVYLEIALASDAEGTFYIDIYTESDHGSGVNADEVVVHIPINVQDRVAPEAVSITVSDPTCTTTCPDVTVEGYYSDIGSGLQRIIVSYLKGNNAAVKVNEVTFAPDPEGSATYTFVDSFFTVMGLAAVFDVFDGSSADTTMIFGEQIIGNRRSDTVAITYSYTDRSDPLVAGSATLFSGTSTTVPQDRWTLFSIPTDIPSPYNRLSTIFANDIDNYATDQYTPGWRVYSWLPANTRYLQMETSEALFKGVCYFYRMVGQSSYPNFNLNFPEGSITLESFDYGSILEANSWNFLGNPFPFSISVASLVGITDDDVNSWYTYNDNSGQWVVITASANNVIPAFGGFIVHTGSNPDLVLKSAAVSDTPGAAKMSPSDDMMIRVELNASGWRDNVDVGFRTGAARDFGDEDYLKFTPSLEDRYLNLGVDNFGWENEPGLYRIDVRDYPSEGESWPLMMYSYNVEDGSQVRITWEIDNVPNTFGVWLIDNYTETRIDMLETDGYSFSHIGSVEDGRFAVVAGTGDYLAAYIVDNEESLPGGFVLHQNYPNPFNPQTTVGFDLARPSEVDLSIYNVLGRKVKTVFDGKLLKGHHEFDWDGTDDDGASVASGVYFYRLQTATATKAKKMLLLK